MLFMSRKMSNIAFLVAAYLISVNWFSKKVEINLLKI
jgi:hypothetical protein